MASTYGKQYRELMALVDKLVIENKSKKGYLLNPFSEWDDGTTVFDNLGDIQATMSDLEAMIKEMNPANPIWLTRTLSLAAKNRAEAILAQSDFYPPYAGVVGAFFSLWALISSQRTVNVAAGVAAFVFLAIAFIVRLRTRTQGARLKMLANCLDALEKRMTASLPVANPLKLHNLN